VNLTDAQIKNAALTTELPQKRTLSATLKVNGIIDVPPQNLVSISMPLGGYLKSTKLLPGMFVNRNTVLAVMEDQQYINLQQEYLSTQTQLNFAEKEYQRQKELNQSQASSDKVYQQAEVDYKNLRILSNALAEKLKLIHINPKTLTVRGISKSVNLYSPIDGYVSKVNVNIGKYVNPSDILFELINPDDIHLNVKVFEKDINSLYVGQRLFAYNNSKPDDKHECEIILISKDLTSNEHSAEVHCHFKQYDKTLLPGMYMNADIDIKNEAVLSIPKEAVVNYEGKEYVFVKKDKHQYEMTPITTGNIENGFVGITNADAIQDKTIVSKGAYTLLMQLKNKAEE
jgi:cobalt-zinc-cadmium efflux system membrane fusion protein